METTTLAELLIGVLGVIVVLAVAAGGVLLYHRHRTSAREHRLHEDLHEQRQDIERREHRIAEREERLDAEQRHLDERARHLGDTEAALESRRAELADLEEERRRVLEGVAYSGIASLAAIGADSGKEFPIRVRVEGPETPFRFHVAEEPGDLVLNGNGEMLMHDVRAVRR